MLYALDDVAPELPEDGSAFVAPTAVLVGRVRLLANASVWWNAVLRGDNEWIEVGEGSNVQDGTVCHTDLGAPLTIGAEVTVGHRAILHGCTLGNGCLIGMGATVLNHAVVGEGALLGAGALVPEGREIPAGSLALGAPAKVVRELSDEQRAAIRAGAKGYVENAQRFAATCKALSAGSGLAAILE